MANSIIQAANQIIQEGVYANIPIIKKRTVYHVGDMNNKPSHAKTGYEGDGLPVSENPNAWVRIAQIGGDLWALTKKNNQPGQFMNAIAADKNEALISRVRAWAVTSGWATQGRIWKTIRFDDEINDETYALHNSKEDAERESDEDSEIQELDSLVATPKMNNWFSSFTKMNKVDQVLVNDMLLFLFAQDQTSLDGVWWNERLDIQALSAPRGSIFQHRLKDWKYVKTKWENAPDGDIDDDIS